MAIKQISVPLCDTCGELWLPKKGPARDDPRTHAKRCGKCKTDKWDWKHKAEPVEVVRSAKCRHRLITSQCPTCSGPEAQ